MSSIPADFFVRVIPSVLPAGGSALELVGLVLTKTLTSWGAPRIPTGIVKSFTSALAVSNFFGAGTTEASGATVYFNGFTNRTAVPANLLMASFPEAAVPAYVQGGNLQAGITLQALQQLTGSLTVVMDGAARTGGSINLSSATSYSAAAALIQTGLNASPPTEASVTGAIAATTNSFTASIAGNVMTVSAITSGTIVNGTIISGTGVTASTMVQNQLSGVTGGVGTYAVSIAQVVASTTISGTYGLMTVSAILSGTLNVGQTLSGSSVTSGTIITAFGSGTGLTGTYVVSPSGTTASTTITASGTPLRVDFDSTSGSLFITSGVFGTASTAAFCTGTLAASLFLTSATGAVLSQGAFQQTPDAFMNNVIQITQNWATFMTAFDPDGGSGNAQKQLFAAWVNGTSNRYAYVCWDTDITPTVSVPATQSMGYILQQANSSGTVLIYTPSDQNKAWWFCGATASIDFNATNGRVTFAYLSQTGLVADVSTETVAANLGGNPASIGDFGNGYNYYGVAATASQKFTFFQRGTITGPFEWANTYVNQIQLNAALQQAILQFMTIIKSMPYNSQGYALLEAACKDPILAAVNFGTIRAGITLSNAQIEEINNAAGNQTAASIVSAQGWYLQIKDASPQVRQARASPPCNLWYCDGGDIQQVTLNSIVVQ